MALSGEVVQIEKLDYIKRLRMLSLMETYYENIKEDIFITDLEEKDCVLLLNDENNQIQGFTTIKVYTMNVLDKSIDIIYSGDTIISKEFWGELELPRMWIRSVYNIVKNTGNNSYWLLLSKGYKTYRFLPTYYKDFYPHYEKETPNFEQSIIDSFCFMKFEKKYDKECGVIKMEKKKDYLKEGIGNISEKHLRNPHIKFFTKKNPGYLYGDELVCLTKICKENIKPFGLRYLR